MSALVLSASPVLTAEAAAEAAAAHGLAGTRLSVATVEFPSGANRLPKAAFTAVVVLGAGDRDLPLEVLGALAASLQPGGRLVIEAGGADAEAVRPRFLLAGLEGGAAATAPRPWVSAAKPTWSGGGARPLALGHGRGRGATASRGGPAGPLASAGASARVSLAEPAAAKPAVWTLDAGESSDEDGIDEAALLASADTLPTLAAEKPKDTKKKPCANCTCGLAEEAEAEAAPRTLTVDMLENPTSGCGSCALGDAFRCGACPYRGLPAFELGKRIQLPKDFLAVDF